MGAIASSLFTHLVLDIIVVLHIVPQLIGQSVDAYVVSAHSSITELGDRNRQDCRKSTNPQFRQWLSSYDPPAASPRAR